MKHQMTIVFCILTSTSLPIHEQQISCCSLWSQLICMLHLLLNQSPVFKVCLCRSCQNVHILACLVKRNQMEIYLSKVDILTYYNKTCLGQIAKLLGWMSGRYPYGIPKRQTILYMKMYRIHRPPGHQQVQYPSYIRSLLAIYIYMNTRTVYCRSLLISLYIQESTNHIYALKRCTFL